MRLPVAKSERYLARLTPIALAIGVLLQSYLFMHAMHLGTSGRWVLPLDDAYIHQQYARQIALGHPFQYNLEDPPTSGATSLIYPFVLSLAWLLGFRGDNLSAFSFWLGALCLFVSAYLGMRIVALLHARSNPHASRPRHQVVGLLAGVSLLCNGALLWGFFSGMEGGLFIVFLLATLDAFTARNLRRVIVFGSLLALTRPEGTVLVLVIIFVQAIEAMMSRSGRKLHRSWALLLPVLAGLLQPLLNLVLTGTTVANGMRAKSWLYNAPFLLQPVLRSMALTAGNIWATFLTGIWSHDLSRLLPLLSSSPERVRIYLPPLLGMVGIITCTVSAIREWKQRQLGPATVLGLWVLLGLSLTAVLGTAEWHYYRYQLPFLLLGLLAGTLGSAQVAESLGRRGSKALLIAIAPVVVLFSIASLPGFLWRFREAASTALHQQIRMGEWIKEHLPPSASVGVHDCGAIRYYGERYTYDLIGLTSPTAASLAWRQGAGSIYEAMERSDHRPSHFAIYDDVHALPYFVNTDLFKSDLFRVEHRDLSDVVSASDHQIIYFSDWKRLGSGNSLYQPGIVEATRELVLVDTLDIADLAAESTHGYRWWQDPLKAGFPTELRQLAYPLPAQAEVLDGGRKLTGGESFHVATKPGQDLLLVGRFLGQGDVLLDMKVNDVGAGQWFYPALPGTWQERSFPIPARLITGDQTHIEIRVHKIPGPRTSHRPYHYWCYQGTRPQRPVHIAHPLSCRVGESIRLLGYNAVLPEVGSSRAFTLTLFWTADKTPAADYKVFVHWVDDQGHIMAQQDNRPAGNAHPTFLWQPGEIIVDDYRLSLASVPTGITTVYVGMYDPASEQRLPIEGGDSARRLRLTALAFP